MEAVPKRPNNFEALLSKAGEYAETKVELIKLKVADKTSDTVSDIAATLIAVIFSIFFLILLSIGLALLIGEWLGKSYYGFFAVAALYGIAGFVIKMNSTTLIKVPVANFIIKKILKTPE